MTKGRSVRPTRGAAILATAAVLIGGLTACGEDEPTEPTSTTASPIDKGTESESPSESSSASDDADGMPEDMPAEAKEQTKEGAAAFGEYYYLQFGEADHIGDTTKLEKLSLPSCPPCAQAIKDIDADAKKGLTRSADPYTVTNLQATKRPDKGFKVSMDVEAKAHHVYKDGEVFADVEAANYTLTEHVVWQHGRWQIADWVIS